MSPQDIATLILRHRIAVTFVALIAGLLGFHLIRANPGYMDSGEIAFTAPMKSVSMFDNMRSLQVAEEAVAWYMMGSQGEQQVHAAGGTAPYDVKMLNTYNIDFPNYSQPYVAITVMSDYPEAVQQTFHVLLGVVRKVTAMLQEKAGATLKNEVQATLVAAPTGPIAQSGSHKRSYAALGVLAIISMYLAARILDRRRRHLSAGVLYRRWSGSGRHAATTLHAT